MPSPSDRQIRVFISSTFRDMGSERDHLVKFIFPQLRKLCESRGVTWGEVDLRWGVTEEAAAEGKVLPICLEEIKRCRPYFIGLLGERYGWVPESIPEDLIKSEPWLEEQMRGRKSVTELEILHGVLRNPTMAGHAYFYFRDPTYLDKLPKEAKRKDFTTEDTESTEKLQRLKQQIKDSGFPVHENYDDPKALGELVLADLAKVIDELYPEGSQPDPLDRETADHEAFAQSRARVYIGRDEYFQKLDAHAAGTGNQPLVILGESGSGKSALLATWALHHRASHPHDLLLLHFIGGTPFSSDWAAMLRRIMGEFKKRFGIAQDIPDQPDALRTAFANWLHMAAAKGRIILILDAINQLEDRDGAPDLVWLPPVMPKNVRLIVSTLPGRALEEINKRKWPVLHVQALDTRERQQLIEKYLAQYTKALSPARAARIARAPQSANPLYLRALLEELRLFGEHERLDERITHYLQAGTVPELYEKILARWEADYDGGIHLVRDAMTLLWAARRGLTEDELLHGLGEDGEPLPRAQWSPLFLAAGDSLVSRSGLLTFFHDYLWDAVRNAYLPTENHQRAAHLRLADYFERLPTISRLLDELPSELRPLFERLLKNHPFCPRQLDELPWQLAEAAAWPQLCSLLSDLPFFDALSLARQIDAKSYWAQLEDNGFRMVDAYRPLLHSPGRFVADHVFRISLLFAKMGHPVEALSLSAHVVDYFRRAGDLANLQRCLVNQALILQDRGDLDGAMALLKQVEQICRDRGDKEGMMKTLGNQALILKPRGNLDGAMALHKQEEQICRELGDKEGLQASLNNQAGILQACGELDGAMALHKQAEQTCRELGDKDGLQASLNNQALILQDRNDLDGAMALHKQAEQICREIGNKASLQASLGNQALILKARGDLDGALALLKQVEEICRELDYKDNLSRTLGNQAQILRARGDLDGAMALHKQEEQICRELGDKDGLQASLSNQALILQDRNDLDGAMALHKQAEQICRELGNVGGQARSLANQAILLAQEMSQPRVALPFAEHAYRLAHDHGLIALARQIQPVLAYVRSRLGIP